MKYFTTFTALILFIFLQNSQSFCQKLTCLSDLSVTLPRLTCSTTITPDQLSDQSGIFDSLIIDKPYLEEGIHIVKLFAIKGNIKIDSCMSNIIVNAPNMIFENFRPDTLYINTTKPYKLLPENVNAFNYASHCIEQKITIKPEYIYCYDPKVKLIFIRYTDNKGNYYETWKELYIVRKANDPCNNKYDKTENVYNENPGNNDDSSKVAFEEDELISREIFDVHGNALTNQTPNYLLGKGIFIVKSTYKNGKVEYKKVMYID
jgi:hypothetical protein